MSGGQRNADVVAQSTDVDHPVQHAALVVLGHEGLQVTDVDRLPTEVGLSHEVPGRVVVPGHVHGHVGDD